VTARRVRRVLIVDDNEDTRDMYSLYLQHGGWHVEVKLDGEEGLEAARSRSFDVIVMDLSMPRMDGVEATRRLKADERTRQIPVLIVTGHALGSYAAEAKAAGADGFCLKPCPPEQLEKEIERVLKTRGT
jgi:two-component system, cell cycle response regulator DivK